MMISLPSDGFYELFCAFYCVIISLWIERTVSLLSLFFTANLDGGKVIL